MVDNDCHTRVFLVHTEYSSSHRIIVDGTETVEVVVDRIIGEPRSLQTSCTHSLSPLSTWQMIINLLHLISSNVSSLSRCNLHRPLLNISVFDLLCEMPSRSQFRQLVNESFSKHDHDVSRYLVAQLTNSSMPGRLLPSKPDLHPLMVNQHKTKTENTQMNNPYVRNTIIAKSNTQNLNTLPLS